jgi:RNA polymerase sigma factor (TIGR02999 family)
MAEPVVSEVTGLLLDWSKGDRNALDRLVPIVYNDLRSLAERYLASERSEHTLQATALVHEAYLKLIDQRRVQWQNRAHFFGVAAQVMRRILVDHARGKGAAKRGAYLTVPLETAPPISSPGSELSIDLLAFDEALTRLSAMDERQGRVVELRFFGGLTVEEIAALLQTSRATIEREWTVAKAWLYRELTTISP